MKCGNIFDVFYYIEVSVNLILMFAFPKYFCLLCLLPYTGFLFFPETLFSFRCFSLLYKGVFP